MNAYIAFGTLAVLLALPSASANAISTGDQLAIVGEVVDIFAPGTAPDFSEAPNVYVDSSGNLWQESNAMAGLQTEQTRDEQGNVVAQPDTRLGGLDDLPF